MAHDTTKSALQSQSDFRASTECHVRCLQFFTPRYPKQPPYKYILRGPGIKYNRWHGGDQLGLSLALPQGHPRQPSK